MFRIVRISSRTKIYRTSAAFDPDVRLHVVQKNSVRRTLTEDIHTLISEHSKLYVFMFVI